MRRTVFSLALAASLISGCGDEFTRDDPDYPFQPQEPRPPDYAPGHCGSGGSGLGSGVGSGVGGSGLGCPDGGTTMPGEDGGMPTEDAGPPPPPCNEHTFRYESSSASSVWVSGSFTDWAETPATGALVLVNDGTGVWTLTTLIEPPGHHEYKLIINGSDWIEDPGNPNRAMNEFGQYNSVLDVCTTSCGDLEAFDWRDAVMYFAMTDRFFDSDGRAMTVPGATDGDGVSGASGQYEGGDLRGVTAKIPYLAELGVTALWLSAPYAGRDTAGAAIDPGRDTHMYSSYHGYWPSPANVDYSDPASPTPAPRVDNRIGSDADLRDLIDAAHTTIGADGQPMKVLFDYVMNHVDIESGLYRAHNDWFNRREGGQFALCGPENLWDDPYWGTRCAFTNYLPDFDFENAAARAWSVNDAIYWAREYGIDGYRLDAIKHVSFSWLTDLRTRLDATFTEPAGERFYLVGETFAYDGRDLIKSFVDPDTMLDGQFDFPLKARLCEAAFTEGGRLDTLSSFMDGNDTFYGAGSIMTTWIGNHDIPRAIHFASREIGNCREGSSPENGWTSNYRQPADAAPYERLSVAFAILMTSPGIPLIYYGDEVGLAGGGDPDNRRFLPSDAALNAHQIELRNRVSALARVRGENHVLSRGRRLTLSASQNTWVYRMTGCGDEAGDVVVAINRSDAMQTVDLPAGSYTDLIAGGARSGGSTSLSPRSFVVLRPAP